MPLHDFYCRQCGETALDVYRSVEVGAQAQPPICPTCHQPMEWFPQVGRMDAFEPGQEFVMYDGLNQPRLVESFSQMREIERDSEQQARNGEGQPVRFRALHQNRSNMLENTFGDIPAPKLDPEAKRRFGLRGAARKLLDEPDVTFGPAVNETNCSALKE